MIAAMPIVIEKKLFAWVVVREAGIALDRQYESDGIFETEEKANKFITENYEEIFYR